MALRLQGAILVPGAVSGAGDINGDGCGAYAGFVSDVGCSGESYLVYGADLRAVEEL